MLYLLIGIGFDKNILNVIFPRQIMVFFLRIKKFLLFMRAQDSSW